jgi:L-cysteine:1D-myo-inositol 2-amino-2-deoxy-alpha-D-glucopyranoside ligase
MKLYNALSQNVEAFVPRNNVVTVYVCGITPYDTTHLGHMFTYATFDTLIRYLEYRGLRVRYAQNVTDIDDDILRKAREVEDDWWSLGNRWTAHFIRDLQELNVRPPDLYPRATDVIPAIVEAVQQLLAAGVGYEANGNVYFHVDAWPEFGRMSRIPRSEMLPIANERGNKPDDPHKRDPLDFVLWQAQAPGEPAWESPWGPGRPGWHIECSTMATGLLGNSIDIHGGGSDLIFPHHECEIAQAECATGVRPFVRFWMHTAMVRHEGEKMSKSLGNLVMVRDLLRSYSPDAIRLYLARRHYRQPWSHNLGELREAEETVSRLREAATVSLGDGTAVDVHAHEQELVRALNNDLDTPSALHVLERLGHDILAGASGRRIQPSNGRAQTVLRQIARIFGLRLDAEAPEARVAAGWNEHLRRFTDNSS